MSRRRRAQKRKILPDPNFHSLLVAKFINVMMEKGKKSVSEKIFYDAMDIIGQRIKDTEPVEVFNKSIENISPTVEVKSRRVGGATYQVPVEVKSRRKQTLAIRWLIGFARKSKGRSMAERLAAEIINGYKNTGPAIKKKEDTHKMAEANKAFAHYRW